MASEVTSVLRAASTAESAFAKRSGLSYRERRRLGLTRLGVLAAVRELRSSDDWDASANTAEIAQSVAVMLTGHPDHAAAWCELDAGFDWQSILDFIEQLIPLILKLIELFSLV